MTELIMQAETLNIISVDDELCTPPKQICTPKTPRLSERKRALFPSASPQSSDLGPISPLHSSPDNSPVLHQCPSPNPVRRIPRSPFRSVMPTIGRTPPLKISPRKRFAELELFGKHTADKTAHTIISTMDENENGMTPPVPHRTPVATPSESQTAAAAQSELKPNQPVTPSKKRSKSLGAIDLGTSPGHNLGRLSLDSRSRSSDLPKARTSLFSDSRSKPAKRQRNDDIYLTGRSTKRRAYGEINKGVRTGIRRPPKRKPPQPLKPHACKVKSVWEVGPKSKKKKHDPLAIFPMFSSAKNKPSSAAQPSGSASAHLLERSRGAKRAAEEVQEPRLPSPEPDPNKRFFKTNRTLEINRKATVTVSKGVKLLVSNGNYALDSTKKRRRLFHHTLQEEPAFDDDIEDPVIDNNRDKVNSILQKLEREDESEKAENVIPSKSPCVPQRPPLLPTPRDHSPPRRFPEIMSSPLLSPLSALASSTSSLSLNLHKASQKLDQVPQVSSIPSVLMEEDELPSCPSQETKENMSSGPKLYPIFNRSTQLSDMTNKIDKSPKKITWRLIGDDQYQIDAGQKRFGHTECKECGLVYQQGEPEDEIRHTQFHEQSLQHMKWKNERILCELGGGSYISLVQHGDPKAWWSKVLEVLSAVDKELGFAEIGICKTDSTKVFLFVSNKQIVGCLVAEEISVGYRMLLSDDETGGVDCCSEESYPVVCGISRIWVHQRHRRGKIASQLMEAMRRYFILGKYLSVDDFAFSAPTLDGKRFASKYTNKSDYLVYM